jgi:hypothetical protein
VAARAPHAGLWVQPLDFILRQGTLARRLVRAVGEPVERAALAGVYARMCECLACDVRFET